VILGFVTVSTSYKATLYAVKKWLYKRVAFLEEDNLQFIISVKRDINVVRVI
jgi:hypothetical protein